MCCLAPLIKLKMFWEFSRQFMSHFCQCRLWALLLSGWRALPRVLFSPKKLPNKAQTMGVEFGKDWALTGGSGAVWAWRTSMKIVTLPPETQTKHRFKNRAPSSDQFMFHTPGPSHTISIHTLPFCCGGQALCWDPSAEPQAHRPATEPWKRSKVVIQTPVSNTQLIYDLAVIFKTVFYTFCSWLKAPSEGRGTFCPAASSGATQTGKKGGPGLCKYSPSLCHSPYCSQC